jgi:hypothetical protein
MSIEDSLKFFVNSRIMQDRANRFQHIGMYCLDSRVFQTAFFLLLLGLFLLGSSQHWQLTYFKCEAHYPDTCINPFYSPDSYWQSVKQLPAGEYGNPNVYGVLSKAWVLFFSVLVGSLLVNHVAWNLRPAL